MATSPTVQISWNWARRANRTVLVRCLLSLVCIPANVSHSEPIDRDWPCVQRKVPRISAGMVWAGPTIDEKDKSWRHDAALRKLVARIAARATNLVEAEKAVQTYADGLTADNRVQKLATLFTGVLATINTERDAVILRIARYARRQQRLAIKIEQAMAELESLLQGGKPADRVHRNDLQNQVDWDTRIFEERERSLTFVCEPPVVLEQRAFALARAIMRHLE